MLPSRMLPKNFKEANFLIVLAFYKRSDWLRSANQSEHRSKIFHIENS